MQKSPMSSITLCADFPDDTQARKFAEELATQLSEMRGLRGGSLVLTDEHVNTVRDIAILPEQ
jgi:hypothetical protein